MTTRRIEMIEHNFPNPAAGVGGLFGSSFAKDSTPTRLFVREQPSLELHGLNYFWECILEGESEQLSGDYAPGKAPAEFHRNRTRECWRDTLLRARVGRPWAIGGHAGECPSSAKRSQRRGWGGCIILTDHYHLTRPCRLLGGETGAHGFARFFGSDHRGFLPV